MAGYNKKNKTEKLSKAAMAAKAAGMAAGMMPGAGLAVKGLPKGLSDAAIGIRKLIKD